MADGGFDLNEAKTAVGVMRYGRDTTLAVIDSTNAGRMAAEIVGVGPRRPHRLYHPGSPRQDVRRKHPPPRHRPPRRHPPGYLARPDRLRHALRPGRHQWPPRLPLRRSELGPIARAAAVDVWDVRRVPETHRVADTRAHTLPATVVLAIGSDCNVGKMSTMLEIDALARERGRKSSFVPTGQTGILIAGWGVALDEVISDFTAGAAEDLVMEAAQECSARGDLILVEGQGSLVHPGYSGVTLSLVHGSAPDAMILCHQATRTQIRRYTLPIPPLSSLLQLYEGITAPIKPAKVVAVSLNTYGMTEADARAALAAATKDTGLPATDPIRFGAAPSWTPSKPSPPMPRKAH